MQALTFFSNFLLTLPGSFTYTRFSRWAVVQLAGRRILTPLIKVRVLAAQPTTPRPHRLAGPGQRPFTPSTGVQIPLGTPMKIMGYIKRCNPFFMRKRLQKRFEKLTFLDCRFRPQTLFLFSPSARLSKSQSGFFCVLSSCPLTANNYLRRRCGHFFLCTSFNIER